MKNLENYLYINVITLIFLMVNKSYFYEIDNIAILIFLFANFLLSSLILMKVNNELENFSIILSVILFSIVSICMYMIQSFISSKLGITFSSDSKNYEESTIFFYSKFIFFFIALFGVYSLYNSINLSKTKNFKKLTKFIYFNELNAISLYIKEAKDRLNIKLFIIIQLAFLLVLSIFYMPNLIERGYISGFVDIGITYAAYTFCTTMILYTAMKYKPLFFLSPIILLVYFWILQLFIIVLEPIFNINIQEPNLNQIALSIDIKMSMLSYLLFFIFEIFRRIYLNRFNKSS